MRGDNGCVRWLGSCVRFDRSGCYGLRVSMSPSGRRDCRAGRGVPVPLGLGVKGVVWVAGGLGRGGASCSSESPCGSPCRRRVARCRLNGSRCWSVGRARSVRRVGRLEVSFGVGSVAAARVVGLVRPPASVRVPPPHPPACPDTRARVIRLILITHTFFSSIK